MNPVKKLITSYEDQMRTFDLQEIVRVRSKFNSNVLNQPISTQDVLLVCGVNRLGMILMRFEDPSRDAALQAHARKQFGLKADEIHYFSTGIRNIMVLDHTQSHSRSLIDD